VARGAAIGAVRRHRVEGVGDGDDPRAERDRLPGQAAGIAVAVEPLVVVADHRGDRRVAEAADHVGAVAGVAADHVELQLREAPRLVEDRPRRVQLADVVQRGRRAHLGDVLRREPHLGRDPLRVPGDAPGVAVGEAVARLEQRAQVDQRLDAETLGVVAHEPPGAGESPLGAQAAQPAPQHEVGEHHVARARHALPGRLGQRRNEEREPDRERNREHEHGRVTGREDRPHRERRQQDHDRGRDQGVGKPALRPGRDLRRYTQGGRHCVAIGPGFAALE
jgi:hypothetical protein